MTQNVKNGAKRRGTKLLSCSLAALFWLTLGPGLSGCHDKAKKGDAPATCTGPSCAPSGRFDDCKTDGECDEAHGFSCVEGECSYACRTHADCIEIGHCASREVEGERKNYCVRDDEPPQPGELYTACPNGDECKDPVLCLGAGAGDLDAYCSIDCSEDADCAPGFSCSVLTRSPCDAECNSAARPSDPRCVPSDQIGEGRAFHCADGGGVERKVCRKREFCAPCDSDADCLGVANQVCARDAGGEKICTKLCDPNLRSCPWGNAAECATFDKELGKPTCSHRFGRCHGDGKTCEPCRGDEDCPGGACASSQFTGERWCVSFETTCSCPNGVGTSGTCDDGGCPNSPGGLTVQCIGSEDSPLFNICYAANSGVTGLGGGSPQTGCWGAK